MVVRHGCGGPVSCGGPVTCGGPAWLWWSGMAVMAVAVRHGCGAGHGIDTALYST